MELVTTSPASASASPDIKDSFAQILARKVPSAAGAWASAPVSTEANATMSTESAGMQLT